MGVENLIDGNVNPREETCRGCLSVLSLPIIWFIKHALERRKGKELKIKEPVPVVRGAVIVLSSPNLDSLEPIDFFKTFGNVARIVMIREKENGSSGGSLMFPGGGVKEGEDLEEALLREVYEETGFVCRLYSPNRISIRKYGFVPNGKNYLRQVEETIFSVLAPTLPPLPTDSDGKIESVEFLDYAGFQQLIREGDKDLVDSLKVNSDEWEKTATDNLEEIKRRERRILMDADGVDSTKTFLEETERNLLEREILFKARVARKFKRIFARKLLAIGKRAETSVLNDYFKDSRIQSLAEGFSGKRGRSFFEGKKGALGNLDKGITYFIEAGLGETVKEGLYEAYVAAFLEEQIEVLGEDFQSPLIFIKLLEENRIPLDIVFNLIENKDIRVENVFLRDIFSFISEAEAIREKAKRGEKTLHQVHSDLEKLWEETFGVEYGVAIKTAIRFFNEYLAEVLQNNKVRVNERIGTDPILSLLEGLSEESRREDYSLWRVLVVAVIHSKIERILRAAGKISQPPLVARFVNRSLPENINWVASKDEIAEEGIFGIGGFKRMLSRNRKVMERGAFLDQVLEVLRDLYRYAVVLNAKDREEFVDEVGSFIENLLRGLRGVEDVDGVKLEAFDVNGFEEFVNLIRMRVDNSIQNLKMDGRVEVNLAPSQTKSGASNPKFSWIKFSICVKYKGGKDEWVEIQFYPNKKEFEEKLKDDPFYVRNRLITPRIGKWPLLRLLVPDEVYQRLYKVIKSRSLVSKFAF